MASKSAPVGLHTRPVFGLDVRAIIEAVEQQIRTPLPGCVLWLDRQYVLRESAQGFMPRADSIAAFIGGSAALIGPERAGDYDVWVPGDVVSDAPELPGVEGAREGWVPLAYATPGGKASVAHMRSERGKVELTVMPIAWLDGAMAEYAAAAIAVAQMGAEEFLRFKAADKQGAYSAIGVTFGGDVQAHPLY